MVFALEHLAESTFADQLNQLESVPDLVISDYAVIALVVIESVVDKSLKLRGLIFLVRLGKVKNLVIFSNLCHLVNGEIILGS